jgi:biopolymer transport protein ExbD
MKFRPSEDEEPEINLIPLIDVLLMTLIFLIVTTSFSKEAQLRVRLPEASASGIAEQPTLRVTVDARGQYFINDKQLLNATVEVLRQAMGRAAGATKDPIVVIQADAQAPHGAVVRVMDTARRLGYSHVTFATQAPSKSDSP